ncbi:MAG: retron St85 family RNA-directed DNA polymerase [Acidobacteriia bacterium]|nr:retron St85 family RNA-directed DNA polymerase [Terriglobia bacterium]
MILERISAQLALPTPFLGKLARTASHRYKEYPIKKKSGGTRTIHHPARELKLIQTWLLHNVLIRLPVHAAATAYRQGFSIKRNAEMHVSHNYLLRIDFQNFFPSLTGIDVVGILQANRQKLADVEVTDQDIIFITQIVCRYNSLTIGAPTSPQLSNAIMFKFDETWSRMAQALEVTYSRYADNLYFSTNRPDTLREILGRLRESLNEVGHPALKINEDKTIFSSRKRRRLAAGLVLTSDRKISIGREKKRWIKSLVNRFKYKQLKPEEVASLRGWISYLRSIEPTFVLSLERKYGLDLAANSTWEV